MRSNDKFPDSGKPFRSARLTEPESVGFANNRITLFLQRGTYRFQCVCYFNTDVATDSVVLMAVTRKLNALEHFPVGTTVWNGRGELLPVTISGFATTAKIHSFSSGQAVELDVLDEQRVVFWSLVGIESIKYVKVGELPPRDPEVNDNHSGAFE